MVAALVGSAAVVYPMPPAAETPVAEFVAAATVNGTPVDVRWTGAALQRRASYRLETRAMFDTGPWSSF